MTAPEIAAIVVPGAALMIVFGPILYRLGFDLGRHLGLDAMASRIRQALQNVKIWWQFSGELSDLAIEIAGERFCARHRAEIKWQIRSRVRAVQGGMDKYLQRAAFHRTILTMSGRSIGDSCLMCCDECRARSLRIIENKEQKQ